MKILLMNDSAEKAGGAENYFYNLRDLLKEKGHIVQMYFSTDKVKFDIIGSIFSIKNLIKSYKKIKEFNPDVVHIHKYNLSLSVSPLISAKLLKKKTVVTFHDFGLLCANGWCVDENGKACDKPRSIKWVLNKSLSNKKLINKLYDYIKNNMHLLLMKRLVDICIGPSKIITNYLERIFSKKARYAHYIINEKWGFKNKKRINKKLLFIGRLEREKGLEYLIKALKYLKPDIGLDIIGKGPEEKRMKELIKKLDIKNNISFIGEIPNKDIQKYYHNSDIVVMPSIWMEQSGIVGLEALASGTPVIASNIGGINDWLKNGENGILVPPRNPVKIAEAVNKMMSKKIIEKYAERGRKIFEQNFTREKHYNKLIKIYKTI